MDKFICFDLEGPLSPQDNAYELMRLFPGGERVFEAISRYDDLLTLEEREGYEPGDTLALIVPFLLYHGISEDDIRKLAQASKLVEGSRELIFSLQSRGWKVFCISTSYEQYAFSITQRVGISWKKVASTPFPLDSYRQTLGKEGRFANRPYKVEQVERDIPSLSGDEELKRCLDNFFWTELPSTKLDKVMSEVKPVGGRRKVEALRRFAEEYGQTLSNFVVVGDSITDFRMLDAVNKAGGLAIAFNANEYALPYSTLGLASTHLSDLSTVLDAWEKGGRKRVEEVVKRKEKAGGKGNREHFHWLAGDWQKALQIHHQTRRLVREEAAKLG